MGLQGKDHGEQKKGEILSPFLRVWMVVEEVVEEEEEEEEEANLGCPG